MTEAAFVSTSSVLSTSCILVFTATLQQEQTVSRRHQDPVVAGLRTHSIATAEDS